MSYNIALYSSHRITTGELADVLQQAGGVVTPEIPRFGRVSHEHSHTWISPEDCYDGIVDEEDFKFIAQINTLLGAECQSCLSIVVSSTPGSQQLAVRFAAVCSSHWPCVITTPERRFFLREEVEQLHREGGRFGTYEL